MVHWLENVIFFNGNFSHNADTRSSTSTHSKIYSDCVGKIVILMLDNSYKSYESNENSHHTARPAVWAGQVPYKQGSL